MFEGLEHDPETRKLVAATVAAEQCQQLERAGVTEYVTKPFQMAELWKRIAEHLT